MSNYVTKAYLETQFQNFAARVAAVMAKSDDIPTKVSELTNDSGFITNLVNDLANYYLKSDTYTKAEVDALLSVLGTGGFEVVESLPEENISKKTIYLLEREEPGTNNVYEEYIYVNDWERIGETTLSLSGYVTTEELNAKLEDYLKTADVETEDIDFSEYFTS